MASRPLLAFALLASLPAAGSAAPIAPDALRAHVEILGSDAYDGRLPGSAGGRKTEAYIVDAFEGAGLVPAAPHGGWLQPVHVRGGMATPAGDADNIVGKVAGSDPSAGAVVLSAHWDHFGECRSGGADRICNGAVDNASGVAEIIEIARAVAAGARPVRDVLFVATTGEEEGERGAKAFADDPSVPLADIVAEFNFDMPAMAPAGAPVAIIGPAGTPLDALIFATAIGLGRPVDRGTWANRFLERQDGWQFLRHGVPAVMFGGELGDRAALEAFMRSRYHTPADDLLHPIPFDGAAEDANLAVALIDVVADPARWPASGAGR